MKKPTLFLSLGIILFSTGCIKNLPDEEVDHESITQIHFKVKDPSGSTAIFAWTDADGEGGMAPVADTIKLTAGKSYSVSIVLFNLHGDELNPEITDQANFHRFYYTYSGDGTLSVTNLDKDGKGFDLGLKSNWNASGTGKGSLNMVLKHYPNGGKEQNDPIQNTKSGTDADIFMPIKIQ